jgi:hypothetical protein
MDSLDYGTAPIPIHLYLDGTAVATNLTTTTHSTVGCATYVVSASAYMVCNCA